MLRKIIEILLKISKSKLFRVLGQRTIADIASLFGYQLTGGLGRLKLGAINSDELTNLLQAIDTKDVQILKSSLLLKTVYAVVSFEEIFEITGRPSSIPELSGPVFELLTYEEFLDLVDSFVGPELNLPKG